MSVALLYILHASIVMVTPPQKNAKSCSLGWIDELIAISTVQIKTKKQSLNHFKWISNESSKAKLVLGGSIVSPRGIHPEAEPRKPSTPHQQHLTKPKTYYTKSALLEGHTGGRTYTSTTAWVAWTG